MKNKILIVLFIVIAAILIALAIFRANNEDKITENSKQDEIILENKEIDLSKGVYPKDLESLIEIPLPDSVVFYHEGNVTTFEKDSYEYKKIIYLNNKRDTGRLGGTQGIVLLDYEKENGNLIEYQYADNGSIYFNLLNDEYLSNNSKENNWVSVGYNKDVFNNFKYIGIGSAQELLDYLYSLI